MDLSFTTLNYNSVETLPGFNAQAAFTVNSSSIFREDVDIVPVILNDQLSYIPWGGGQQPNAIRHHRAYREGRNPRHLPNIQCRGLLRLRSAVWYIDLEASLAEEWLSPELMSALRSENLRSDLTEKRKQIVMQVKAQIISYLRGGSFSSRRLADIVNFIRQNEAAFKEWHDSDVAKLFAPPVFRNRKNCAGYFF